MFPHRAAPAPQGHAAHPGGEAEPLRIEDLAREALKAYHAEADGNRHRENGENRREANLAALNTVALILQLERYVAG